MHWIKIPAATISFCGLGTVLNPEEVEKELLHSLLRGLEEDDEVLQTMCVREVKPVADFITYGIGIPLMTMRYPEKARGRAPVSA
jgi:hypothetical protein